MKNIKFRVWDKKRVEEEVKDWPDYLGHLLYDKNTQRVAPFKTTDKKSKKARKTII